VRFKPMKQWDGLRTWREACRYDRTTKKGGGKHGGAIGHAALRVLHVLLFDFRNWRSGQLDPSYAAIAAKANVAVRTVGNALRRLKELGILTWQRRCSTKQCDGRTVLEQESNAYTVLPEAGWVSYEPKPKPPPPDSWGQPPRMPDIIKEAVAAPTISEVIRTLEMASPGTLEAALASLGRRLEAKEGSPAPVGFEGAGEPQRPVSSR